MDLDNYVILHSIAEGSNGCTMKAITRGIDDTNVYAMKIIQVVAGPEFNNYDELRHEVQIAIQLSKMDAISPFNVKMYDTTMVKDLPNDYKVAMTTHCRLLHNTWFNKPQSETHMYSYMVILMEYVEGKSLTDIIWGPKDDIDTSNKFIVEFIFGLLRTLLTANSINGFAHNDLSSNNIMMKKVSNIQGISNIDSNSYTFRYKPGSTTIPVMIDFDRSTTSMSDIDRDVVGSFNILSPEILVNFIFKGYMPARSVSADVWAVGMNALYMLYPLRRLTAQNGINHQERRYIVLFNTEFDDDIAANAYNNTDYDEYSKLLLFRAYLIRESFSGPDMVKVDREYGPTKGINDQLRDKHDRLLKVYNESKTGHPLLDIADVLSEKLDGDTMDLLTRMFHFDYQRRISPDLLNQDAFGVHLIRIEK